MLVFGEIVAINKYQVRLRLPDYDNFETDWYFVPQLCTVEDKSYNMLEIGTTVAAVASDNLDDGCIIGALYNDEDVCIADNKNLKTIHFSDGSLIEYNKETHNLTLNITEKANITAKEVIINGDLKVNGNVSDQKGTMQTIRDVYNSHTHGNGHNGANTDTPDGEMN